MLFLKQLKLFVLLGSGEGFNRQNRSHLISHQQFHLVYFYLLKSLLIGLCGLTATADLVLFSFAQGQL